MFIRRRTMIKGMMMSWLPFWGTMLVVMGFIWSPTSAQENVVKKPLPFKFSTIRRLSWQIPKASQISKKKPFTFVLDGVDVQGRSLDPPTFPVDYENYFIDSSDSLTIMVTKVSIVGMTEYSIKGKVFAYSLTYSPYQADGSSVSGLIELTFLDSDGDGLFDERTQTPKLPPLPGWVKR